MAAFGEVPSNNWSAGLYYKRKYEEHQAREKAAREKELPVIEAEYTLVPSPPLREE